MILRTRLVQVRVIDTHAPHYSHIRIIILFFYEDWICQPIRMQHLHNEPGRKQPSDLITDSLPSVLSKTPKGLFYRLGIRPT